MLDFDRSLLALFEHNKFTIWKQVWEMRENKKGREKRKRKKGEQGKKRCFRRYGFCTERSQRCRPLQTSKCTKMVLRPCVSCSYPLMNTLSPGWLSSGGSRGITCLLPSGLQVQKKKKKKNSSSDESNSNNAKIKIIDSSGSAGRVVSALKRKATTTIQAEQERLV